LGFVYVAVAIAWAVFAGRSVAFPYSVDGDLFWQRELGNAVLANHALPHALGPEAFAAAGAPWVPQEWLLGIAASLADSHGALAVLGIAAATAAVLALFLSAARAARAGANALCNLFAFLLGYLGIGTSYGIRAQVFAWPLFSALLYVLDYEDVRALWAVPVVVLWANVHASVMLAIPIVWVDSTLWVLRRGVGDARARIGIALAVLVPLATLATPLGIRLPLFALTFARSPIRQFIVEWRPIDVTDVAVYAGALPLLALGAYGAFRLWRAMPRDVVVGAALAVMMCMAMRNVALFSIAAIPLAANGLTLLLARFRLPTDPMGERGPRTFMLGSAAVLGTAIFVVMLRSPLPIGSFHPPQREFAALSATSGDHRIFCTDFTDCSVALQFPNLRVFLDGRADAYPLPIWNDFNAIRFANANWDGILKGRDVNAVLVKTGDALDLAIRLRGREWHLLQGDDFKRLYTRVADPRNSM
jgi:hypothetical protein